MAAIQQLQRSTHKKGYPMVTLKDVARKAGVSMSTASAALRGKDIVKPDTTQRVLEAANTLNYRINLSARALRSGKSDIFTMIVPDLENQYYAKMANAMSNVLTADKKRLVVQISMYDSQRELDQIRQIDPSTCDGLFICSTHSSGKDIRSAAGDLPVLMFDDMSTDPEACYDSIETPSQTGMYAAIKHLAERERKTIGIVGTLGKSAEAEHSLSVTLRQTRYAYAYQALGAYGLNTDNAYIQSDWSVEAGIEVAHKLAASGMQYDALCCMNDELALGVMRGLAECGVNVPDDVAVIGFDGVGCGSYTTPMLSTIAVDFDGMAQTAATMMQQQIEQDATERNNSIPKRIIVGFQLLKRESTMGRTATTGFTTKTRTEATMTADES